MAWMQDCGFDDIRLDAVGNVVGVYQGQDPNAPRLLTGSHYDTVRNGGKYDGRLGILVPMACVRDLHRQRRRLTYGIEVVGFAEEEGQRYKATFLGSGALVGDFKPEWLEQVDADGITMKAAMQAAGLSADLQDIGALKRNPTAYRGFVEVHIEQGPVLDALRPAPGRGHLDQRRAAHDRPRHRPGLPRGHHPHAHASGCGRQPWPS
jgi:N-carbamoyl-L-amino-acid hydrolase